MKNLHLAISAALLPLLPSLLPMSACTPPPGGSEDAPGLLDPNPPSTSYERCDGLDDDLDSSVDEGCPCTIGETQPCYTGDRSTLQGACSRGEQACAAGDGGEGAWGTCAGAVTPTEEVCEDGIDQNCDGIDAECAFAMPESCDTANRQTLNTSYEFPATTACTFGEAGNLSPADSRIRARTVQEQSFDDLPEGAVLCAANLTIPPTPMDHADWLLVTVSDVVVLSSLGDGPFPRAGQARYYDWPAFQDAALGDGTYCAGDCSVPPPNVDGSMELRIDGDAGVAIAQRAVQRGDYGLKVIVAADKDPDDCRHSPLQVQMELSYVVP